MKMIRFMPLLAVAFSVWMSSCSKEGATGPAGPAGPAGTANVTVVTFAAPAWSGNQINLTVPQITSEIYNSGTVLAYMEFSSVPGVFYHVPGFVVNAQYQVRVYHQTGSMRFNLLNPDGTAASGSLPAVTKIKILVIPAGTVVTGRFATAEQALLNHLANAGVDVNDYEQVKRYFGING